MVAYSSYVALRFLSFGSIVVLRKPRGRMDESGRLRSMTAFNPSIDASVVEWKGRSPGIAALKSGKAKTSGLDSLFNGSCTISTCSVVNTDLTSSFKRSSNSRHLWQTFRVLR